MSRPELLRLPVLAKLSLPSVRSISSQTHRPANQLPKYVPLEDVEDLERYFPGGYHPTAIGDRLCGRYRVVHKLGFGTYSTVWLARDERFNRYVAVKIATADSSPQENQILRHIGAANPNSTSTSVNTKHPGQAIIPPILDEFVTKGPNGEHRCMATAPARMSLSDARESSYSCLFQLPVARAIAAQLIQAVAFLHSRGSSTPAHVSLPPNVPPHGIRPVWLGTDSELIALSEANVLLADFGESFLPSTTVRYDSMTPILSAPPEVVSSRETRVSFPADIWSLACTIWSLVGARPLFEGLAPSVDWMIKAHVTVLGKLPAEWWTRWDARLRWFNEDGTPNQDRLNELGKPWEPRFERFVQEPRRRDCMDVFGDEEKSALFTLLKAMLAFNLRKGRRRRRFWNQNG